jgi:hypothetical protein
MPHNCGHLFPPSEAFFSDTVTCQNPIPIYDKEKIPFLGAAVLWTWVHYLSSLCRLHWYVSVPNSLYMGKGKQVNGFTRSLDGHCPFPMVASWVMLCFAFSQRINYHCLSLLSLAYQWQKTYNGLAAVLWTWVHYLQSLSSGYTVTYQDPIPYM